MANSEENVKNPPLYVAVLKAVDSHTKREVVECHVFVVGLKTTAMKLVESCQKAFGASGALSAVQFYKKYNNIPVVFCMKSQLEDKSDNRIVVKSYDDDNNSNNNNSGYFYATEYTPIDCWQLFESTQAPLIYETVMPRKAPPAPSSSAQHESVSARHFFGKLINGNRGKQPTSQASTTNHVSPTKADVVSIRSDDMSLMEGQLANVSLSVNPYAKADNLVKVEKRVDPKTGQTIFVRWLSDETKKKQQPTKSSDKSRKAMNDVVDLSFLDDDDDDRDNGDYRDDGDHEIHQQMHNAKRHQPIVIRQAKTPSPIIVEKYITKKAPQVIIKEIHVHEPAPPPLKYIENVDGRSNLPIGIQQQMQIQLPQQQHHHQQQQQQQQQQQPAQYQLAQQPQQQQRQQQQQLQIQPAIANNAVQAYVPQQQQPQPQPQQQQQQQQMTYPGVSNTINNMLNMANQQQQQQQQLQLQQQRTWNNNTNSNDYLHSPPPPPPMSPPSPQTNIIQPVFHPVQHRMLNNMGQYHPPPQQQQQQQLQQVNGLSLPTNYQEIINQSVYRSANLVTHAGFGDNPYGTYSRHMSAYESSRAPSVVSQRRHVNYRSERDYSLDNGFIMASKNGGGGGARKVYFADNNQKGSCASRSRARPADLLDYLPRQYAYNSFPDGRR